MKYRNPIRCKRIKIVKNDVACSWSSPCKTFLDKIDDGMSLDGAHGRTHIVSKTTRPADRHAHGANLLLYFFDKEQAYVGTTGEHLDGGARADNVARVLRACDKDLDTQEILAVRNAKNRVHVWPDPFEGFVLSDDPDQRQFSGGDSAGIIAF